jgi:hypothetical protein
VLHVLSILLHLFHHSRYTWLRAQITQLLVIHFSPPSRHFVPVESGYRSEKGARSSGL